MFTFAEGANPDQLAVAEAAPGPGFNGGRWISYTIGYGAEVQQYWGEHADQGRCSEPELFFSERGLGLWMVTGDRDTLLETHDTEDSKRLTAKGQLLSEDFVLDFYDTGDAADAYLGRLASVADEIG